MGYTTLAKIKSQFRQIQIEAETGDEDQDTVITEEDITLWISESDAQIDATLGSYYITPITGSEALKIMSTISTYLVSHRIKTILELDTQVSDKKQEVQTNLEKKAEKMLSNLMPKFNAKTGGWDEPIMIISDATKRATSPDSSSIFSYNNNQSATFKKNGNNW